MENEKNEIEIKIENIQISKKEEDKNENNQICYICQETLIDSINPAGCNHVFCRAHLKVIYIMK